MRHKSSFILIRLIIFVLILSLPACNLFSPDEPELSAEERAQTMVAETMAVENAVQTVVAATLAVSDPTEVAQAAHFPLII